MRSSLVALFGAALVAIMGCTDTAIVVWEQERTLHGQVYSPVSMFGLARPLPNVVVGTTDGQFSVRTDNGGEWTVSVASLNVPTTIQYVCPGYDTSYTVLYDWNPGRDTRVQDVFLSPVIADTLTMIEINVDSLSVDSLWYTVNADVPDSLPFLTICFSDMLEVNTASVWKQAIMNRTFIILSKDDCKGLKRSQPIETALYYLLRDTPVYASASLGRPLPQYGFDAQSQREEILAVNGLGPLLSWKRISP